MDPQIVEYVVLLVGAVLGTTGLAGLLSGSLQWTRRARLRRNSEQAQTLMEKLSPERVEYRALQEAVRQDTLELASMSIVQPFPLRIFVGMLVALTAFLATLFWLSNRLFFDAGLVTAAMSELTPAFLGLNLGSSIFLAVLHDHSLITARKRYMKTAESTGEVVLREQLVMEKAEKAEKSRKTGAGGPPEEAPLDAPKVA